MNVDVSWRRGRWWGLCRGSTITATTTATAVAVCAATAAVCLVRLSAVFLCSVLLIIREAIVTAATNCLSTRRLSSGITVQATVSIGTTRAG